VLDDWICEDNALLVGVRRFPLNVASLTTLTGLLLLVLTALLAATTLLLSTLALATLIILVLAALVLVLISHSVNAPKFVNLTRPQRRDCRAGRTRCSLGCPPIRRHLMRRHPLGI